MEKSILKKGVLKVMAIKTVDINKYEKISSKK